MWFHWNYCIKQMFFSNLIVAEQYDNDIIENEIALNFN